MPDPLMGLYPSEPCSPHVAVRRLRRRSPRDVCTPQTNTTADDRSPRTEARCDLPPETLGAKTCDRNRSLCTARHGIAASSPLAPKRAQQRETATDQAPLAPPPKLRRVHDLTSPPGRTGTEAPITDTVAPATGTEAPITDTPGVSRRHPRTDAPAPKHRLASATKRRLTAEQHRRSDHEAPHRSATRRCKTATAAFEHRAEALCPVSTAHDRMTTRRRSAAPPTDRCSSLPAGTEVLALRSELETRPPGTSGCRNTLSNPSSSPWRCPGTWDASVQDTWRIPSPAVARGCRNSPALERDNRGVPGASSPSGDCSPQGSALLPPGV
jgi:hypothetical protein